MNIKKKSMVWRVDLEILKKTVNESISLGHVLENLGIPRHPYHYRNLKRRITECSISIGHFNRSRRLKVAWEKGAGKWQSNHKVPLANYLRLGTELHSGIKDRIFREGVLEEKCCLCGQGPSWHGKYMALHLDHINGIHNDNRLENLRILCPNCHATTDTYCRGQRLNKRNQKHAHKEARAKLKASKKNVCDCGTSISHGSLRCRKCDFALRKMRAQQNPQATKITWPPKEELEKMVQQIPCSTLAKQLGVSDKAIEKHCKKLGISKPPRGHWMKTKTK